MLENGADVIVGIIAVGLAVLCQDVEDIKLQRFAFPYGVGNAADKEVRDDAGIETSRADDDDIGAADGVDALLQRGWALRDEPDLADPGIVDLFGVEDLALAEDAAAVVELRFQMYVLIRDRQHAARDGQNVSHAVYRFVKRTGNAVHGSQKQIAEALPGKAALGKAVVEQLLHGRLGIGKRHDAVADIARRQHAEILPQHAGAAAVVCDGHNGGNVLRIGLQAAQHGGQTMPAADGGDPRRAAARLIQADLFRKVGHGTHLLPMSR